MQLRYIYFTVLLYVSNKLFPNGCSEEAVKSQQTTADNRINIFAGIIKMCNPINSRRLWLSAVILKLLL